MKKIEKIIKKRWHDDTPDVLLKIKKQISFKEAIPKSNIRYIMQNTILIASMVIVCMMSILSFSEGIIPNKDDHNFSNLNHQVYGSPKVMVQDISAFDINGKNADNIAPLFGEFLNELDLEYTLEQPTYNESLKYIANSSYAFMECGQYYYTIFFCENDKVILSSQVNTICYDCNNSVEIFKEFCNQYYYVK